jgi:hypothetical protein
MKAMSKGEHMGKIVIQLPEDASDLPVEPSRKVNLRPQSCYVIVGGLGGLGELIATWLAKAGAAESKITSQYPFFFLYLLQI